MIMVVTAGGAGGARPQYKTALSVESHLTGDTDLDLDLEAEGHKYRRRRRATIIAIVAIFGTAGAILVFSVVHDLQSSPEVGFLEQICSENDPECVLNQCPEGYDWISEHQWCELKPGTKQVLSKNLVQV